MTKGRGQQGAGSSCKQRLDCEAPPCRSCHGTLQQDFANAALDSPAAGTEENPGVCRAPRSPRKSRNRCEVRRCAAMAGRGGAIRIRKESLPHDHGGGKRNGHWLWVETWLPYHAPVTLGVSW